MDIRPMEAALMAGGLLVARDWKSGRAVFERRIVAEG
jgi:hypothetical protein